MLKRGQTAAVTRTAVVDLLKYRIEFMFNSTPCQFKKFDALNIKI